MRTVLIAFLALPAMVWPARARVLAAGQGAEFATIRDAIAAAAAGDIIRVAAGTYQGNLVLDKPLTVEGAGQPVIRGGGRGSVVTVTAPGCVIRGFIIEHSGPMLVDEDSGVLLKSDGNRVEQNQIHDVLFGIYLFQSHHNTIAGNSIRGRSELEPGERGGGIHIWNSHDNTISGNTISYMRDGMYLQNADRSAIRGNRVSNLRYGLHYMYSNDNVFEDNIFERNVAGAAIMYSRNIQFRRNAFVHNRGFSSFGILFQDSEYCFSEKNLFVDNAVGIFMEAQRNSRFEGNLIASNDLAIEAFSNSEGNEFTRNNFAGNLSPIHVVGKDTHTNWNHNYWSDYEGYDLNGDGVGDAPFRIQNLFEHLEGNYPRLRIYFFSPASQALALAEKSFPVIGGSRELDRFPLMAPVPMPPASGVEPRKRSGSGLSLAAAVSLVALASMAMWKERRRD